MKYLNSILSIIALTIVLAGCKNTAEPEIKTIGIETSNKDVKPALDPNATYAKVEFNIEGMTCAMGCAKAIEKKMAKMEGVKMAKVDFEKELAMVEYDEAKVTPNSLEEAVAKVGKTYKAKEFKVVEEFTSEKEKQTKKSCEATCKKKCSQKNSMANCSEECKKECEKKA